MTLTIYDAAMTGVVVLGMIWGAWKGITWQVASIASLVLGYAVAHALSPQLAPRFPGDPAVARALAMLAVYVGVAAAVFATAWGVRATLKRLQFEAFDRHLGMVLGGLEGALLGVLATFFVVSLAPQSRGPIFTSPTGKLVATVLDASGPVLPAEARDALTPFLAEARRAAAVGAQVAPLLADPALAPTDAPAPTTDAHLHRTSDTRDDGPGDPERR